MRSLALLEARGMLANSLVFISGDHGDMHGEHGEEGHGQYETNWWSEKYETPYIMCQVSGQPTLDMALGKLSAPQKLPSTALRLRYHAAQLRQIDVMPSLLHLLGPMPPLLWSTAFHGTNALRPLASPTPQHPVVQLSARYFPMRHKQVALLDGSVKWWFYVSLRRFSPQTALESQPEGDRVPVSDLAFVYKLTTVIEGDKDEIICSEQLLQSAGTITIPLPRSLLPPQANLRAADMMSDLPFLPAANTNTTSEEHRNLWGRCHLDKFRELAYHEFQPKFLQFQHIDPMFIPQP